MNLSSSYLREATLRTRSEFQNLFTPAEKTIRLLSQWGRSGLLKTENISDLNEKLIPVIKEMDRARGITLADSMGNEYSLSRRGNGWRVRQIVLKNLHTGQKGKEIEIAWLKGLVGFMNTDGGILVIGVDDDGQVLGLKSDGFENEDKIRLHYKNLIGQHIGPEFSRFLRFDIKKVKNEEVIIFEAREAGKPVFLKNKNDEAFYIRSGPSSERLTVSQVLNYIENKKTKKK